MELTRARIQEIRKGIAYDEPVTDEQEEMLSCLGIDWEDIIAKEGRMRGVTLIQQKINGKLLQLHRHEYVRERSV